MKSGRGGVLFSYEATSSQPQLTAAFRVSPTKLVPMLLSVPLSSGPPLRPG